MTPLSLDLVKNDQRIRGYIQATYDYLKAAGFTDHGFRHAQIVSDRAAMVAHRCGLSVGDQGLAAVAGYCHDMGNFMGRNHHHKWGGLLFLQCFQNTHNFKQVLAVAEAIIAHDRGTDVPLLHPIDACLILADKSDVSRTRVLTKDKKKIMRDIHDRVNHAVLDSDLVVQSSAKTITLRLKVDPALGQPMEYFEIFNQRMTYCRRAATSLGYHFRLQINSLMIS